MRKITRAAALGLMTLFAVATGLAGCDAGPSATAARGQADAAVDDAAAAARASQTANDNLERPAGADAAPLYRGKPLWSANRKYTAEENAEYHFRRNGEAFGANSVDAFVAKAHAFVSDPPEGSLTLTRRNGDVLIYDPRDNVFAVVTKDGAPRTMFRPDDGMAYWEKQKERESKSTS